MRHNFRALQIFEFADNKKKLRVKIFWTSECQQMLYKEFYHFLYKRNSLCFPQVKTIVVEKKVNEIINRLNKTKEEKDPNFREEREQRDREERNEQKKRQQQEVFNHFCVVRKRCFKEGCLTKSFSLH